jgi:hypothetical protein
MPLKTGLRILFKLCHFLQVGTKLHFLTIIREPGSIETAKNIIRTIRIVTVAAEERPGKRANDFSCTSTANFFYYPGLKVKRPQRGLT